MNSLSAPQNQPFPWPPERVRAYVREMTAVEEIKGHWAVRILIRGLVFPMRKLSWEGADRFGTAIGKLMYLLRVRRKVAMTNLDIAYGDRKTTKEKEAIYRDSLIVLGRHVLDYMRAPLMDEKFFRDRFEFEGEELLREVYNRGRGVIFIGGHIGIWEFAASRIGTSGYPISIVAKKLANPVVDRLVVEARIGTNLGTIAHIHSMDRIKEGLKRGEGIIMAVDQNMKRSQGVFVEWMGRQASTVRSNAWLAREAQTPVLVGYAYRTAPGCFKLVIPEEVPWEPHPEDPDAELLINTRNQVRAVEKVIYQHPELWLWLHRRWKVQPEGTPNPYK